jgi:hypothetical protein
MPMEGLVSSAKSVPPARIVARGRTARRLRRNRITSPLQAKRFVVNNEEDVPRIRLYLHRSGA